MAENWDDTETEGCITLNLFGEKTVNVSLEEVSKELIQDLVRHNKKGSWYVEKDGETFDASEIVTLEAGDTLDIKSYTKPGA